MRLDRCQYLWMTPSSATHCESGFKTRRHGRGNSTESLTRAFPINASRAVYRNHVNEKLREMERLEESVSRIRPLSLLSRKKRRARALASEIGEVREELVQVLLFLHLRE